MPFTQAQEEGTLHAPIAYSAEVTYDILTRKEERNAALGEIPGVCSLSKREFMTEQVHSKLELKKTVSSITLTIRIQSMLLAFWSLRQRI
jgi:hypothetical protein